MLSPRPQGEGGIAEPTHDDGEPETDRSIDQHRREGVYACRTVRDQDDGEPAFHEANAARDDWKHGNDLGYTVGKDYPVPRDWCVRGFHTAQQTREVQAPHEGRPRDYLQRIERAKLNLTHPLECRNYALSNIAARMASQTLRESNDAAKESQ